MRRLFEYLAIGLLSAVCAGLLYVASLWGLMARNARREDLPVFTTENFEQSWLPALIIFAIAVFAIWGFSMYDRSDKPDEKD